MTLFRAFRILVFLGDKIASFMTMLLAIALVIIVFFQVINRFILHIPAPWTEELARYMFVWVSLVGAAKALKDNAQVRTYFLISKLPYKIGIIVALIGEVVALYFYFYIMFFVGWKWSSYGLRESCDTVPWLPMFYMYVSVPFSGVLMSLFSMNGIVDILIKLICSNKPLER